jgi:hypothetical protein
MFDEVDAISGVIAGLDPAIHLLAKKMDPRVKPAGDSQTVSSSSEHAVLE